MSWIGPSWGSRRSTSDQGEFEGLGRPASYALALVGALKGLLPNTAAPAARAGLPSSLLGPLVLRPGLLGPSCGCTLAPRLVDIGLQWAGVPGRLGISSTMDDTLTRASFIRRTFPLTFTRAPMAEVRRLRPGGELSTAASATAAFAFTCRVRIFSAVSINEPMLWTLLHWPSGAAVLRVGKRRQLLSSAPLFIHTGALLARRFFRAGVARPFRVNDKFKPMASIVDSSLDEELMLIPPPMPPFATTRSGRGASCRNPPTLVSTRCRTVFCDLNMSSILESLRIKKFNFSSRGVDPL
mmetsp:Transcript_20084/g.34557  ORF Transcript_20084/g.34557 Transcript_20084/m.34557 type:complete len:297 (+) Transcript_20084:279-1169(+)